MPQEIASLAKLSAPDATGAVRRVRLFHLIDEPVQTVWIAAPPGAGKTTLAASYFAAAKRPILWYRLDRDDADPATFFYLMGLAAAKTAPRRRIKLPLLTPEYLPDLPGFTRRFFRALFGYLPANSLLVFDNCHELDSTPVFQDILREALSEIPAGRQCLVLSRTPPPASLARLLANRQLRLMGWDELRLTPEETQALAGPQFGAVAASCLHELADGWAAGVILLRQYDGSAPQSVPSLLSRQAVFDYFISEIFSRLPAAQRELLLATAFFADFTAGMADTATTAANRDEAAALLDSLCRQQCFVERNDKGETCFRYHDLFRDFLRNQAGTTTSARRQTAAHVLVGCGRTAEAIPLLLENGDREIVPGLIVAEAPSLITHGRWQTLAGWIDALPAAIMEATPWLMYWRGIAELPVNPQTARSMIERAHAGFSGANDTNGRLLASAAIMEANYHEYSDFSVVDKWLQEMEALGGMDADFPSVEVELRALTGMLAAIYTRYPCSSLGQALTDRLEILLERDVDPNLKGVAATFMLWFAIWTGDFAQARRVHAFAARLLAGQSLTPLTDIMLRSIQGHGQIFLGDAEGARAVFDAGEAIARRHGFSAARTGLILPMQIYRHLMFGDLTAAEALIAVSEKHAFVGAMNAAQIEFCRSWLALLQGNVSLACARAQVSHELAERSGSFIARVCTLAARTICLVETGDCLMARQMLTAAWQVMAECRLGVTMFHLRLVEAWVFLRSGDATHSRTILREALAQGAAQGYASTMQWLPTMMSELCAMALRDDIEPGYVRSLIRLRRLQPPDPAPEDWPWPLEIRTLGGFEVLRDGKPIAFPRKIPKKPIALLKVLVTLGRPDCGVPEQCLTDALWPDTEGDAAGESLSAALHRLRKLLDYPDAIRVGGGRIGIDPNICRVDAWAFESLAGAGEKSVLAGRQTDCVELSKQALTLYRGHFLDTDSDANWAISTRERLRMKFIQHVAAMTRSLCERKACDQVIELCERGLDADDLIEKFYQELMRCHRCLGRNAEGLAVYRRMKRTLSIVLGIAPSAESEALHRALLSPEGS